MRPLTLLILISAFGLGCVRPQVSEPSAQISEPKAWLEFKVFPKAMVVPGKATLHAKIHGPIEWCPQTVRWVYDSGSSSKDVGCLERIFTQEIEVKFRGLHRFTVEIFSGAGRPGFAAMDYQVGRENE